MPFIKDLRKNHCNFPAGKEKKTPFQEFEVLLLLTISLPQMLWWVGATAELIEQLLLPSRAPLPFLSLVSC